MPVELKVPSVGESITEVQIGTWKKAEGDAVAVDEEIVELESDKATFDAPAPVAGVITKILKKSGEIAAVGEIIAYIDESATPAAGKAGTKQASAKTDKKSSDEKKSPATGKARAGDDSRIMPAAQRLLDENGLKAEDVTASGPGGRLLKEDVQKHLDQQKQSQSKPAAPTELRRVAPQETSISVEAGRQTETVPMTSIRRRIAERLVSAQKNAALLTTFNEVDMTAVNELRKFHKDAFLAKHGVKLGFMSFFVKASIDALKQFPQLNAQIRGTDIIFHNYFDIGVAIGTEKGLVVPVLRNAERMGFAEIESTIEGMGRRARDGKLSIEELQGGTFTISNGGIYGSLLSTPIVNPPQSGVLGMHAIQDRPVVRNGQIVIRPMMYLALSYDHRIVDGREAVTFLRRIKESLEEPARMLLEV